MKEKGLQMKNTTVKREHGLALVDAYVRLRRAAQKVVDDCTPAGGDEPRCAVAPHRIRRLRRELAGEPQASTAWMSVT